MTLSETAGRHPRRTCCTIVPPYLLRRLAVTAPEESVRWERLLALDTELREQRTMMAPMPAAEAPVAATGPDWVIHTAAGGSELPGTVVRTAGEPASGDVAVDEAADGIAATLATYLEVYARDSYDGAGATVSGTVHYEQRYDNAFWDGNQLVFGDGDGEVFDRFTKAVDVLAHELTHAVTERTAGLVYQGQSGALNESLSDVFGSCVKQRLLGQRADEADWLIGAGLFLPGVQGRALRDMAHPGTAYDDPRLGQDPQPARMADYVETTEDNGGVHLNSGIPNRAFQLAAVAIGGASAEGAGAIWYAALTGGLPADADFATFAAATIAAAGAHADAVRTAWVEVGVAVPDGGSDSGGAGGSAGGSAIGSAGGDSGSAGGDAGSAAPRVSVRRTGGFAGLSLSGALDLDGPDQRVPEVRSLLERVDLQAVAAAAAGTHPDAFVYDFDLCGETACVPEPHLSPDLRRLAELLLE